MNIGLWKLIDMIAQAEQKTGSKAHSLRMHWKTRDSILESLGLPMKKTGRNGYAIATLPVLIDDSMKFGLIKVVVESKGEKENDDEEDGEV